MSTLCPIFKKGNLIRFKIYWDIFLIQDAIVQGTIPKSSEQTLEIWIWDYQSGFINKKSINYQILKLAHIMGKYKKYYKYLHLFFGDYKQLYDNLIINQLWITLENFGTPKKLINLTEISN